MKIKNDKAAGEYAGKSFGEYLRKCEESDHMDWDDKSNLTIVSNLKAQVVAKINSGIRSEEQSPVEGTASKLSGKYAVSPKDFYKFTCKTPFGGVNYPDKANVRYEQIFR